MHIIAETSLYTPMIATLVFIPFLFSVGQSCLSTWMLFVTMQLISHLTLLHSLQPMSLLMLLRAILNAVRLGASTEGMSTR